MSFVDRVVVDVVAGRGGDGSASFARFKYQPKGGPDGGDGGHGGSVVLVADNNLATLLDYRYRSVWQAQRGVHGRGKKMTGATAPELLLPVPPGTIARDADTDTVIGEVLRHGDRLRLARGGRGGRGNSYFTSPTNRAPREFEPGGTGEQRRVELVLKLIADVGLVGEPNAGKSTLLSVISAARPKIADYPFTTLEPNLGVVGLSGSRTFVVADIPGIIEGAHQGRGLGLQFLQHVERTRILAFLVPLDAEDPQAVFDQLRREVALYSPVLADKPFVLVQSKRDLLPANSELPRIDAPGARASLALSSASGQGIDEFNEALWLVVQEQRANEQPLEAESGANREQADDDDWDLDWGETDSGVD